MRRNFNNVKNGAAMVALYNSMLAKFGGSIGKAVEREAPPTIKLYAAKENNHRAFMQLKPVPSFQFKHTKGKRSASQRARANRRKA